MPAAESVKLIITNVPPSLRAAIVRDARLRDVSVNEAAVAPLCAAYGIPREPATASFVPVTEQDTMALRVPVPLRRKLRARAAREDATIAGLVKACLAEYFELPVESTKRRPRG